MKKDILIMFGGISAEHEVSVITGLQVLENIDNSLYEPYVIYINKNGVFKLLDKISSRKDFNPDKGVAINFGVDLKGGYIEKADGLVRKKVYPYSAYLAFHGGNGENGSIQGMLESFQIPFTSSSKESSVITMNKQLTKELVANKGVNVVKGLNFFSIDIKEKVEEISKEVIEKIHLPVIVKPVHLGSSIGIKISKTEVELQKALLENSYIDTEILVEEFLDHIVEYNCSVRFVNGILEVSSIEKPYSKDEILSFADKYQRGGKKIGNTDGMASLQRELPAKIDAKLQKLIEDYAVKSYIACRCKGLVRIDFMFSDEKLYLTEVNSIPGSMAYYLWEANGLQFKQQISDLLEQSVKDFNFQKSLRMDYESDIINKFIQSP